MSVDPIDWVAIETAMKSWLVRCTDVPGERIRARTNRDTGEARGPGPKITFWPLAPVVLSKQMRTRQEAIMQMRLTVVAGAGTVGIEFYPGKSATGQMIAVVAGGGDPPDVTAAALLVELSANLPAPYTAILDPEDLTNASILVNADATEPEFALLPVDDTLLTTATTMPRYPIVLKIEHFLIYRIFFRADNVSGANTAQNLMNKAQVYRRSLIDKDMLSLGAFRASGTLASEVLVDAERDESTATLDLRWQGFMTGAEASTLMRRAGLRPNFAPAA